jgi:hypothetical protein
VSTVSEILDRASKITGLKLTGNERTFAHQSFKAWYKKVLRKSGASDAITTYTFVGSSDDYLWTTILAGSSPSRINGLWVVHGGGGLTPIKNVGLAELMEHRMGAASPGIPELACGLGTRRVAFYNNPTIGTQIKVAFTEKPADADLEDNTADTPSLIDDEWHDTLLVWGTVAEMVTKDAKLEQYKVWVGRADQELADYIQHVDEFMGDATPLFVDGQHTHMRYPDERRRFG